jgi:hypothetical protein
LLAQIRYQICPTTMDGSPPHVTVAERSSIVTAMFRNGYRAL